MKRFLICLLFFCLACTVFSKQIIGTAIRTFLRAKMDCQMVYRALDWEEGELVFTDLAIFERSFQISMDQLRIHFDWSEFPKKMKGSLSLESPYLTIKDPKGLPDVKESWFDFSIFAKGGILEWGGPVSFSLDYTSKKSKLNLDWEDAEALFKVEDEKMELSFSNFNIALLKPWIPHVDISEGALTGKVFLSKEGKPFSANLQLDSLALSFNGSWLSQFCGSLSYNEHLGAKWDVKGIAKAQEKSFPIQCEGRGFFKNYWVESKVQFEDSWIALLGEETWDFEGVNLKSEQLHLLQSGLGIFWDEANQFKIISGLITAKGLWSPSCWNLRFEGENLFFQKEDATFFCKESKGLLTDEEGAFFLKGEEYDFEFDGKWKDWKGHVRFKDLDLEISGKAGSGSIPIKIEKGTFADFVFQGEGWVDSRLDCFFSLDGKWDILNREIPFQCPILSKVKDQWTFDFRFCRKTWDLFRLVGMYDGHEITYSEKSHLLGQGLSIAPSQVGEFKMDVQIPRSAVLPMGVFLKEWGVDLQKIPAIDQIDAHFSLKDGVAAMHAKGDSPQFNLDAVSQGGDWTVDLHSELNLHANLKKDGTLSGNGGWKTGFNGEFEGKIDSRLHWELSFKRLFFDLSLLEDPRLLGSLEGRGHLIYNGEIEADLDFEALSLTINGEALENEGQIHLHYLSEKGAMFRGINLHGSYDCKMDLLEYDRSSSRWIFHDSQIHLNPSFFPSRFLQFLDKGHDLNFTADLEFPSDFSTFICTMKEGFIPYQDSYHHIENLHLFWNGSRCEGAFYYLEDLYRFDIQIDENLAGRLILGEEQTPLTIDWEYTDALLIHSIEGSFGGVGASFHAESPNFLVGSAHVDFEKLSQRLPSDAAKAFREIKMGKGYEFKGRLRIEKNLPYFQGILSGKAIELFGFQFKTLLAQVDLRPEWMHIYDVKISDKAGMMKIDEIILSAKPGTPWTISMPNLAIFELRPSLLQRPGKGIGPLDPLVVRELKLTDFKGLLDDGKTYTAKGGLHFINSYKRDETVFDLPANVLSRIVGLDLELLIPVKGDLTFDLSDGYFHLLELSNSYSEGERSQFFLEMEPPPIMDLDGNLKIFIKMKQFVLLKFTESFLISIDGKLDEPDFHLKKKKFFGLL